jgi:hypothetical protein
MAPYRRTEICTRHQSAFVARHRRPEHFTLDAAVGGGLRIHFDPLALIALRLLTISVPDANNLPTMLRAALVALALVSALSITFVLVTPDSTDDAVAIEHQKAYPRTGPLQKLFVSVVQALTSQAAVILQLHETRSLTSRLNTSELTDLLCEYRC